MVKSWLHLGCHFENDLKLSHDATQLYDSLTLLVLSFGCRVLICRFPIAIGSTCELDIDECTSMPCQNGGMCRNNVASFICDCPQPYKGAQCALLPCQVNPCGPGGSNCTDDLTYLPLGFRCECKEGYTGESFSLSFFLSIYGEVSL